MCERGALGFRQFGDGGIVGRSGIGFSGARDKTRTVNAEMREVCAR